MEHPLDMKTVAALLAGSGLLLSCLAFAQSPSPGTYVTEGGWGTLNIRNDGGFALETLGANGHSCNLEGRIVRSRATLEQGCKVRFGLRGAVIQVGPEPATEANRQACREYCGMRAHFDGDYVAEQAACRDGPVKAERAAFLADYKGKRFPQATARLEKLLDTCGRFLWWMTEAEIRNDLGLAQHRAGRSGSCQATLKPLERLFDPGVGFPPVERDWADHVLPQIRHNIKLCGQAPATARP